jgi:hypothetical protein
MRNGVTNKQIRALSMAMAGATVAAVATMFIPVAMLESLTGSTGISELVPAAAAPLGDTARAMIAFGVGALTLAVLGYLLPRQSDAVRAAAPASHSLDEPKAATSLSALFAGIAWPKMPWTKGDDDITELSDLPKLRNGDSHPDAPPRRPLSAHQDLPVLELNEFAVAGPDHDVVAKVEQIAPVAIPPATPFERTQVQPSLADMVAQFEAAVAERQRQLAELEAVAAQLATGRPDVEQQIVQSIEVGNVAAEPARAERPPLEAVPASAKDDDMDTALAAALATLHRMNGTSR